jgi:dTDP-4-amino-4,6-dideoxygalactose transaminase
LAYSLASTRPTLTVPFVDLLAPHAELRDELGSVFRDALDTAAFIGGPMVDTFERAFAEYCGARYAIGAGSGTDALRFALIAAGVQPGDTVLTVPNTFIATAAAISQAGARPEFVDVDERTCTMDPGALCSYLAERCSPDPAGDGVVNTQSGSRIRAVVPVHLYGQMADMDPILEVAAVHGLVVVEDACQAHGAEYFSAREQRWCRAGSMGVAAAFSFYPGKNLGACGEAGAVVTNDERIVRQCRMLRDHGQATKYVHEFEGYNGRLDAIQAGILSVKLRRLDGWNEQRRSHAAEYDRLLSGTGSVTLPHVPLWSRPVHHLYVVRVPDRDAMQKRLAAADVSTGIHYPFSLHLCRAYQHLGFAPGSFPVAESAAREVLSLPMFPGLTPEQQAHVASVVRESITA